MFCHVGAGQAVQAEDVSVLSVLVDFGESLICGAFRETVFTRQLLHVVQLHWRTVNVHASQRQQERQQHVVLHGEKPGMTLAGGTDARQGLGDLLYPYCEPIHPTSLSCTHSQNHSPSGKHNH